MTTPIPEGNYQAIHAIAPDYRIHYHEAGPADGHTVIFLHGSGAGASGYSNFKGNYPAFAEAGFRVIVPDMLGYGLSTKPDLEHYDLDFFISGVKGLVDELGLKNFTLLGNSLGGAVSLGYTLKYPDAVNSLILMAPGGVEDIEAYFEMDGIRKMFEIYQSGKTGADAVREVLRLQLFDPSDLDEATVQERAPVAAMQANAARSRLGVPNMTPDLHRITCPILGFWGVNDSFTPPGGAQKILDHCQDVKFIMLNRCGHWVQVEHKDYFNRMCVDFLREVSG